MRTKFGNNRTPLGILLITIIAIFALCVKVVVLIVIASVITSGIKSVSDKCDKTYAIEDYYVKGDLFCEVKE